MTAGDHQLITLLVVFVLSRL